MTIQKLSIVTPAYKCTGNIWELYKRLIAVLNKLVSEYEIIFVNDASPENDWDIINEIIGLDTCVKGISFSRNFGQHYAITAGVKYATGDAIIVMDCDLQDQPEEIPKLYNKFLEGFDVVFARRYMRQDNTIKKFLSKSFSIVYGYLVDVEPDNSTANFGIYSRKVIDNYKKFNEQNRCFPIFVKWMGFKTAAVDVAHGKRYSGKTSYNFNKMMSLAIDSVVSQSNKPLRMGIKFGFTISAASILYTFYLLYKYFVHGIAVQGWTSMMVSLFFLSGLLFANMGLLGLYIGKIFDEAKGRPLYIIDEMKGFSESELLCCNKRNV